MSLEDVILFYSKMCKVKAPWWGGGSQVRRAPHLGNVHPHVEALTHYNTLGQVIFSRPCYKELNVFQKGL